MKTKVLLVDDDPLSGKFWPNAWIRENWTSLWLMTDRKPWRNSKKTKLEQKTAEARAMSIALRRDD